MTDRRCCSTIPPAPPSGSNSNCSRLKMKHTKLLACASGAVLAFALACSKNSPAPAAPSGAEPGITDAAPDGSTLKVTAPTPQSPVNNAQPDDFIVLVAQKSQGKFGD